MLVSLVFRSHETLLAARDTYGNGIDVSDRPKQNGNKKKSEGMMASLFGMSLF